MVDWAAPFSPLIIVLIVSQATWSAQQQQECGLKTSSGGSGSASRGNNRIINGKRARDPIPWLVKLEVIE